MAVRKREASGNIGDRDLERVFALSLDLLCIAGMDGRFHRLSHSWTRVLGWTETEITTRPFLDFVHPDDVESTIQQMEILKTGGAVGNFINRYRTKTGEWRHLSWRSASAEKEGIIFAVARDVTDQIALREELMDQKRRLSQEKARLHAIMDTIPDLLFIKDSSFHYTGCNPPFTHFIGREEGAILGHNDFDFFAPEIAQFFRDQDLAMLESGAPRRNEEWVTYPDGTHRFLDTLKVPFKDEAGESMGLIGISRDITERFEADTRLHEREALYRASVEASVDGFWLVDMTGTIRDANSAYARMSGYEVDELRGMRITQLDALQDQGDVQRQVDQILKEGSATFETRHRRKDGTLWDVEVTTLYAAEQGGRIFSFLRDLRRRRRAETLLKARLHLAEIALAQNMDLLLTEVLDTAERLSASTIGFFHFIDDDQQTLTLQAWSTNTLANMCKAEGKHARYPVSDAGIWADSLRLGKAVVCNDYARAAGRHGLPQGHAPVARLMSIPVPSEKGFSAIIGVGNKSTDYDDQDLSMVTELAVIAMDIVERMRSEAAQRSLDEKLARTARMWQAAMDTFEGGLAVLDPGGRLIRANAAFYTLTKSRLEDHVGRVMKSLHGGDAAIPGCHLPEMITGHVSHHMVMEADYPGNPSGLPLEFWLTPIRNAWGAVDNILVSLYDLTAAREQEQQLLQTVDQLTHSKAELERFTQVTAHDLQEPTRRQSLYVQLLKRRLGDRLDPESASYLAYIIEDANRMRDMVRSLGVYSEAGHSTRLPEEVDLDRLVLDLHVSLIKDIELAGARLERAPLGTVRGEPAKLRLLFLNLLTNAIKFRRPDRRPLIRMGVEKAGNGPDVYYVADNGVGIDPEYLPKLFTLFRRLGRGDSGGTGMGLAQCRRVVEERGGRIWIEDNDQGGATVKFTLTLPDRSSG